MSKIPTFVWGGQGIFLLFNGIYTLLLPTDASAGGSPLAGTPIETIRVMSLSSLSLGTLYLLLIRLPSVELRRLMLVSVPFRALAAAVMWGNGGAWKNVATFEALMGGANLAACWWAQRN